KATLDRNQQPARGGQGIRYREIDARPAVDQDQVVFTKMWGEHVEQHILTPFPCYCGLDHRFERQGGGNQVDAGEARGAADVVERMGAAYEGVRERRRG